jgi:hypothetical protein
MVPEESFSPLRTSPRSDRDRAAPCSLKSLVLRGELEGLWRRGDIRLQKKILRRLPFHPPARREEILGRDVDDLELDAKSAMTHDLLARSLREPTGTGARA